MPSPRVRPTDSPLTYFLKLDHTTGFPFDQGHIVKCNAVFGQLVFGKHFHLKHDPFFNGELACQQLVKSVASSDLLGYLSGNPTDRD
ncbi:MAG: hypothetical protein Ct9H300mP13_0630 [Gammaproteobacteria bacterium]|nr:MAG: hypothetical protein Ct9H300mP13_0630 [Gammaproteobacteria bacterium]